MLWWSCHYSVTISVFCFTRGIRTHSLNCEGAIISSIGEIETGFLSLYLSCVFLLSVLCPFVRLSLFCGCLSVEFPLHVTMVWYLYLVKGVLSRFCSFLDKGVGCELPEKLMVEIGVHCNGVMEHWSMVLGYKMAMEDLDITRCG